MITTLGHLQSRFRILGKMIYLAQQAPPAATAMKRAHVALIDQQANLEDVVTEFDINNDVVTPLGGAVRSVTEAIANLPSKVKSAVETYLRRYVAPDLGLSAGAVMKQVGPALVAKMTTLNATVAPAVDNPTGFAAYFATQFAITLPTGETPNVPDDFITDAVL